ncbi:glycosyltransferase family 2 protein [Rhodocytophaga rosea]|uniref:Glycosyltransferase family 2 protein n=1 Tax=Rhodocytophaga rosea TaxID=2704465 RepID=A0A6C0GVN2_9BACT|nr:glycosyltransferase family 2 protein [Rhodocytophaga rosea]
MHISRQLPLVSIITVNYNKISVTREFLQSIQRITYPHYEVIVVDNASIEAGFDELKNEFPAVIFIKNPFNTGFAGGNNVGVKVAKGAFLLFLNNDTEVETSFLKPLVDCLLSDERIGMASPKIKYFDSPDIIQYAGGVAINRVTGRGRFIGNKEKDSSAFIENTPTELIHGAAMMVSRKLLDTIGPMDEQYFLYYEELDWCERAKKAGFSLYFVGQSVVYHKESTSVGKNSALRTYYLTRNRLLFIRKNFRGFSFWSSITFFFLVAFPKNIFFCLFTGKIKLLVAFIKGVFWHLYPKNWS